MPVHSEPWKCLCVYCCSAIFTNPTFLLNTLNSNIKYSEYNELFVSKYKDLLSQIDSTTTVQSCIFDLVTIYEMIHSNSCVLMNTSIHVNTAETVKRAREKFDSNILVKKITDVILDHLRILWPVFAPVGQPLPF